MTDLSQWSEDDEQLLGACPGLVRLCEALVLEWDIDGFAREHFGGPGKPGSGDVHLCRSRSTENLAAIDLHEGPHRPVRDRDPMYRYDAGSYEASLVEARRIFDDAGFPVSFRQAHTLAEAESLVNPASFPRRLLGCCRLQLHLVAR